MTANATVGISPAADRWTPARLFMLASALWHVPLGVVGLVIDQTFPVGPDAAKGAGSEHIFGVFETNGWHSVAALVLGVVSLYFTMRPQRAREAAMVIGVIHVALVIALTVWPPETFWIASNSADQVVHSSTAIVGIAAALMTHRALRGLRGRRTGGGVCSR